MRWAPGTISRRLASTWHELAPLEDEEVERVLADAHRRIERVLVARGLLSVEEACAVVSVNDDAVEYPLFANLLGASATSRRAMDNACGAPLARERDAVAADRVVPSIAVGDLVADEAGYSLHAATRVEGHDFERKEHLCRYVSRPALAQGRLIYRDDGKVVWNLRRAWRDGTRAFVFEPLEFLARLAALIPHPREHQLTYHGSLAPASPIRDEIAPRQRTRSGCGGDPHSNSSKFSWAELLQRVFAVDVLRCPRCGDRRRAIAVVTDPTNVRRVLEHLRLRSAPLECVPARPPPQATFDY